MMIVVLFEQRLGSVIIEKHRVDKALLSKQYMNDQYLTVRVTNSDCHLLWATRNLRLNFEISADVKELYYLNETDFSLCDGLVLCQRLSFKFSNCSQFSMEIHSSYPSTPLTEQVATSSTCQKLPEKMKRNNYQRRSIWIKAKRIFRKRLLAGIIRTKACNMELALNVKSIEESRITEPDSNESFESVHRLLAPVLLQVFPYLDIYDRIRLRRVS